MILTPSHCKLFSQLTVQFYDRSSIINPCLDSSVRFVEKLVHEVKQMHASANIPLESYHFGGVSDASIPVNSGDNPDAGFRISLFHVLLLL